VRESLRPQLSFPSRKGWPSDSEMQPEKRKKFNMAIVVDGIGGTAGSSRWEDLTRGDSWRRYNDASTTCPSPRSSASATTCCCCA